MQSYDDVLVIRILKSHCDVVPCRNNRANNNHQEEVVDVAASMGTQCL
jgi:Rtr1/RPAP2 family